MCKLIDHLNGSSERAAVIFEDNHSAVCMAKNTQYHGKSKHIDIKYHFIRDQVKRGVVKLKYCRIYEMVADMVTKALPQEISCKLCKKAGVMEPRNNSPSEKEC